MIEPGDVISYIEMCQEEGASLQRGMNFRLRGDESVILMSLRPGAPYPDRVEDDGRTLIYEGHNAARRKGGPDPYRVDQPSKLPSGVLTQNGLFLNAALSAKAGEALAEHVKVYEKIRDGIWAYNGVFSLVDAWQERSGRRKVYKFKLILIDGPPTDAARSAPELPHNRLIPSQVKLEVWKRDGGKCVLCGSRRNLHLDHDIPYSEGGSSLTAKNIRILCAKHNLQKHAKIL